MRTAKPHRRSSVPQAGDSPDETLGDARLEQRRLRYLLGLCVALLRVPKKTLLGLALVAMGVAGIVVACLPDLETTRIPVVTPTDASCGNGFIEPPEQCDPGVPDTSVPGCTRTCKIDCDAGDLPTFLDPTSNHCYFLLSSDAETPKAAAEGCKARGAHVVTLGSQSEQLALTQLNLSTKTPRLWLGLEPTPPTDGGAFTYSAVVDEPGVAAPGACRGCYAPNERALFPHSEKADGSAECVTWRQGDVPLWSNVSCDSNYPTVCEREPVGSRSYACNMLVCFTVPATVDKGKVYLWGAEPTDASAAAAQCAALGNAEAGASPVIFEVPGEREQVFYELLHLPTQKPPTDFWIGLTSSTPDGGGRVVWTWDDGRGAYYWPLEWGDHEPRATQPGVRAFAMQTGTDAGYGSPGETYDTQLVHAMNPREAGTEGGPDAGDGGDAGEAGPDAGDGGDGGEAGDAETADAHEGGSGVEEEMRAVLCQKIAH
jgi:Lectin C-type domain